MTIKEEMFNLYGRACLACGNTEGVIPDHVIPKSQGGQDVIENLQPLCITCNGEKAMRILDWRTPEPRKRKDAAIFAALEFLKSCEDYRLPIEYRWFKDAIEKELQKRPSIRDRKPQTTQRKP